MLKMNQLSNITDELMYILCIETTKLLQLEQEKLNNIQWVNGEANIDTEYSQLACECCCNAWDIIKQDKHRSINIHCENPDITIKFIYPDGSTIGKKIELKSSKRNKMPGSTINTLDINQPLIYCLRPSKHNNIYKIRCAQYHVAMGDSSFNDLFQDRTPRPLINFAKMNDIPTAFELKEKAHWITHYADCALHRINDTSLQKSWQDDLVKNIKLKVIQEYLMSNTIEEIETEKLALQMTNFSL